MGPAAAAVPALVGFAAAGFETLVPAAACLAGSIYSCGGAGGADAPATAPGRWPGLAPVQTGAASILLSCVHFLALCYLVHFAFLNQLIPIWEGAELPFLPFVQNGTGNTTACSPCSRILRVFVGERNSERNLPRPLKNPRRFRGECTLLAQCAASLSSAPDLPLPGPRGEDATYVMRLRAQTSIENTQAAWHAENL